MTVTSLVKSPNLPVQAQVEIMLCYEVVSEIFKQLKFQGRLKTWAKNACVKSHLGLVL